MSSLPASSNLMAFRKNHFVAPISRRGGARLGGALLWVSKGWTQVEHQHLLNTVRDHGAAGISCCLRTGPPSTPAPRVGG